MTTSLFAMAGTLEPRIRTNPLDYLADAPTEVRWRAWWGHDGDRVIGIDLHCYPVMRVTPHGAWIDQHAYYHRGWVTSETGWRWVSNTGGQAWAKPTRQAALDSLAIRYERWATRIAADINYFRAAGDVLKVLMPDRATRAFHARELVRATGDTL